MTQPHGPAKGVLYPLFPKRKHTNNGMLSPVDFEIRQQKLNEAGV
jgi:hypothetical protein